MKRKHMNQPRKGTPESMNPFTTIQLPDGNLIDYAKTPRPLLGNGAEADQLRALLKLAERWHRMSPHCEARHLADNSKAKRALLDYGEETRQSMLSARSDATSIFTHFGAGRGYVAVFVPPGDDDPDRIESGWAITEFRWEEAHGREEAMRHHLECIMQAELGFRLLGL